MVFTILENALNLGSYFSCPASHPKRSLKFLSSPHRQKEITHSPRQHFFENLFCSTAERNGGNYVHNSMRKYEVTWIISLFMSCMIYNF